MRVNILFVNVLFIYMTDPNPHTVFIVPYRNREENKKQFEEYLSSVKTYNKWDDDSVKVFYIHQKDDRPFNRGGIKNIGFFIIRRMYPETYKNMTFVFHDIDSIPETPELIPYTTIQGEIAHYYGYKFSLGGMFSIKGDDFEKSNGFPNLWGWGYEDTILQDRVLQCGFTINRSTFFDIRDEKILRPFDGYSRLMSKRENTMYKLEKSSIDNMNDITQIRYEMDENIVHVLYFRTKRDYDLSEFINVNVSGPNRQVLKSQKTSFRRNWTF